MKKKLIVFVTFLFVLVSIVGVLAACKASYTVTFKNGDEIVKEVEVEEGNALAAADIPAAPTAPTGKVFDGWYVGTTKVEAGYTPTENVTAEAKFKDALVTVKFVANDTTVKEVTITYGTTIPANDLPSDPTPVSNIYVFEGWYDANGNEFVETAPVTADVTYTAKFIKEAYVVTFMNGETVVKTVDVAKVGGTLAASDIPAQDEVADKVAQGWYTADGVKAVAGAAITADVTYYSTYVGRDSYVGSWFDTENHKMIAFTADNKVFIDGESYGFFYEDGKVTVGEGMAFSRKDWTLSIELNTMTVVFVGYDEYEDLVSETYVLTKGELTGIGGIYRDGSNKMEIVEGGAIPTLGAYARLYANGESYTIEYFAHSGDTEITEIENVSLKDGILVINLGSAHAGMYVKSTSGKSYTNSPASGGTNYLYVYTTDDGQVIVYKTAAGEYNIATVEGTLAAGEIITINIEGKEPFTVKLSAGGFAFAGDEAGTYTLDGQADLVLDGFGNATLGEDEFTYVYVNGHILNVDDYSAAYELNSENGTYTVLAKDGNEGKFVYELSSTQIYQIVLTGFGDFVHMYNGGSRYIGSYTISGTTMTVVNCQASYNGQYTLKDGGKIIVSATGTSTNGYTYILEGYTPAVDPSDDFEGEWQDDEGNEVVIDLAEMTINYKGKDHAIIKGYEATSFTFEGTDARSFNKDEIITFTVTLNGNTIVITYAYNALDEYGEGMEAYPQTETYTKQGGVENPFNGTWKSESGSTVVIDYAAKTISYNGQSYALTVKDEATLTFIAKSSLGAYPNNTYTFTVTIVNGQLQIVHTYMTGWDDMDEDYTYATSTETYTKQDGEESGDALKGKWVFESWTFEFDGNGNVTINGTTTVEYEFDGTNVSFRYDWEDWTGTLSEDGNTLTLSDEYGDSFGYNHPCTRA
ncbi:MAG: hypothetical protein J1G02_02435 [Clostridiales bacterium]|nr:hypothetical protein [Clostridiales bacterium]